MNAPITTLVKQRKSSKFPVNQEVAMKADGSGGPVSVAKKKDACYAKVKSRYKKWPSAYASGALVKCRKVGATNWGNKSK
jgi:hypothetical protein